MNDITTQNAIIKQTSLGREDEEFFSFWLRLDYDGSGQAAGGYCLGGQTGLKIIDEILKVLEVETWEKLPGTFIRVQNTRYKVVAIGHIMKDKWLNFEEFWKKELREEE
jgi:hypothetical protein